ncbi:MAG: hypothetical protein AABX54_00170 [Nanoarchaeota archaeon]
MEQDLIERGYIPLDKSWMIRMGVLDLVNGYGDSIKFLKLHYDELCSDLQALYPASIQWKNGEVVDVKESGTLFRFLKFASWKFEIDVKFKVSGTLRGRKVCNDASIINLPLERLLILDNGTSQWASASVIMGNPERIANPPYKLQLTYDAILHWKTLRNKGECWKPKFDETILAQASAYIQWLKDGKMDFVPLQAEDYCFARAFNIINAEQGEKRWPSLRGHESDRISEMEKALQEKEVSSKDHRIVQAVVMLRKSKDGIIYPECVKKSWPQFWRFFRDYT